MWLFDAGELEEAGITEGVALAADAAARDAAEAAATRAVRSFSFSTRAFSSLAAFSYVKNKGQTQVR